MTSIWAPAQKWDYSEFGEGAIALGGVFSRVLKSGIPSKDLSGTPEQRDLWGNFSRHRRQSRELNRCHRAIGTCSHSDIAGMIEHA